MDKKNELTLKEWLGNSLLGTDIVEKKYLLNDGNGNYETLEDWANRISGGKEDFKELFLKKKFIPAGRILSNRGLDKLGVKGTLSNCFVLSTGDSIEEIYKTCSDMARTYSYGGGVGVDISSLRPNGAIVKNSAKTTTGAVSFMKTFDVVTGTIGQNSRRGALMISISSEHPDLEEFIDVKANTDQINNANISVRVSNEFMKAVADKNDYILRWPCNIDISKLLITKQVITNMEYNVLKGIDSDEYGRVYIKKVKAWDLFRKIAKNNWDYGEPGILYWDRIENYHLMSKNKNFKYAGVNPCVTGDTKILTDKGYVRIDSVVGEKVNIWNGFEWSEVIPKVTGHDQDIYMVCFSNGTRVKCTKYHKFLLTDGRRVEAKDLKEWDRVPKCTYPVIESPDPIDVDDKIAYTSGYFSVSYNFENGNIPIIILPENKTHLAQYITFHEQIANADGSITLKIDNPNRRFFVPDTTWSIKSRLIWLSGFIDADGYDENGIGRVSVRHNDKAFLRRVQLMLQTLGVRSTITRTSRRGRKRMVKIGEDKYEERIMHDMFRLRIHAKSMVELMKLGLKQHILDLKIREVCDTIRKYDCIRSIRFIGVHDTVYCFNEPKNHTAIFDGCLTCQCAEEPLPDGGACLLGSMNLYEYAKNDGFDWEMFDRDVRTATRWLNEIQEENIGLQPLEIQKKTAKEYKQIGLGLFDLAGTLIKLGIKYGDKEAQDFAEKVTHRMLIAAFEQSCDLNTEGVVYDNMFDSEFYQTQIKPFISEKYVNKYPLNSQLLTIAPTGSISTMLNAGAGGGEPIFRISYTRDTKSIGEKTYHVCSNAVLDYFNGDNYAVDESILPEYFITADKIAPINRIEMQSALQQNIDASISSTINLPKTATVDDIYDIYFNAWKKGLKGVTVFRDGCKRIAILNSENSDRENETIFNTVNAPKRPKVLDADYYQVSVKGENFIIIVGLLNNKPYELFALPCESEQKIKNHKGKITRLKKRVYKFESEFLTIDNIAIEMNKDYNISDETKKISEIANEGKTLSKFDTELIKESVGNIINWCDKREYRNVALHVSGNLRTGMRVEDIIKLEEKCADTIVSFPKVIARVLSKYQKNGEMDEVCPECGEKLIMEGGCKHCPACSWSACG